jgi:DNA-binding NarL/FixJ family response regulator
VRHLKFTRRQVEILELLIKGHQDKQIAQLLGVSPNTIKNTLSILRIKADCSNRVELAMFYARLKQASEPHPLLPQDSNL